jgi:hypothetical protein
MKLFQRTTIFIGLSFSTVAFAFGNQQGATAPRFTIVSDSCIQNLKQCGKEWRADSLGQNGFRDAFTDRVLARCSYVGMRWTTLRKYLGKANRSESADNEERNYMYFIDRGFTRGYVKFEVAADGTVKHVSIRRHYS